MYTWASAVLDRLISRFIDAERSASSTDLKSVINLFLRPYKNEKNVFQFPQVEDIDVVPSNQIRAVLQEPVMVGRGRIAFQL